MIETRFALAAERLREIAQGGADTDPRFAPFFTKTAGQLVLFTDEYYRLYPEGAAGDLPDIGTCDLIKLQARNRALYEDILEENYSASYANPAFCVREYGEEYGKLLSALVYEVRSVIPLLFENDRERALIRFELFLEVCSAFSVEKRLYDDALSQGMDPAGQDLTGIPSYESLRGILRDYVIDYSQDEQAADIRSKLVGGKSDYPLRVLKEYERTGDPRWLYAYGEYITDSETGTDRYLSALSEETVKDLADVWSEGFRIGFIVTGKDLSKKKRVGIIGRVGFERLMAYAAANFSAMGKDVILYREIETIFSLLGSSASGLRGCEANPQYRYDHREDLALILDEDLLNKLLASSKEAYRQWQGETRLYAGPAVLETFGEKPFTPAKGSWQAKLSSAQQKLIARYRTGRSRMYNEAVIGENRSFTIISFPVPDIAGTKDGGVDEELYGRIFDAVRRINRLDYRQYRDIQGIITDALNRADYVHVTGRGDNRTDLKVNLYKLKDPDTETIFENCVADVNIPVGEVFTTPVLSGTEGVLHTTQVYLEGMLFKDLEITFKDGRVADYRCGNFEGEEDALEKGREYIRENILFHHDTLPMGECAIGTNTTAYVVSRRLGIEDRLPILIAEKTGPHFAVGDTCYSDEEDNISYNPDGKRIVARENDYSLLRHKDPSKAYFGCHTDITIPYDELGTYDAVTADGRVIEIIKDGRFVLPGTEELNTPFDEQE